MTSPDDAIGYQGPSQEYQIGPGSLQDTRFLPRSTATGYHNIDLLNSLIKAIIEETQQLITSAESVLVNFNLIIDDDQLKAAQLAEWPPELGVPKDYISYEQYKTLKTLNTRGSAYIIKVYNEKIRSAAGTNSVDIINISNSIQQEAIHIKDFLNDAVGSVSDSAEFRIVELFQDWAHKALRDTRLFRSFFDKKGSGLQQIPASELVGLTPAEASPHQALLQIKLNLINQDLSQLETDFDKATGQQAEIFYKRFLGPSLKVKLKVTNNLSSLAGPDSFLGQQAQAAIDGLTLDYKVALQDQMSRIDIYFKRMEDIKDRLVARDTYAGWMQQLASAGTPIPQVFVSAALTSKEQSTWKAIAAANTVTPNPTTPATNTYMSLHNKLDGRDVRDAHDQYLLRSKGTIVGDINVIDGVRIDGIDLNRHAHNGKDGSAPISGFSITEGSLPPEATSTDPPSVPIDFKLKLFQSKVLPPGLISIDATLSWQGNIYHTYEIQIVKENI